jgi:hypothetical protein
MIEVLGPDIYGAHWVEYTRSQEGLRTLHFPGLRRREVATGVNKRYQVRSQRRSSVAAAFSLRTGVYSGLLLRGPPE